MGDFAVYYVEANIVCAVVFGILLFHNHFNIDRQEKQIKFDHVLTSFIVYFVTDSIWAELVAGVIPRTRFAVVSNTFIIYLVMAANTYFWLDYVMALEQAPHRNRPINRFAVIFPFLVSTAVLIIQYLIAPETLINEKLEVLPGFYIYLIAVPWIYLIAILFYTVRKARSEENPSEKRKHLLIGLLPLTMMVFGFIQMLFPYTPIFCFGALILMLMFYIQSIENRISLDPLTNLNNRGQLRRYLSQKSNVWQDGRLTFVDMLDINDFKAINDNYGHAEGDKALIIVADSLKNVINRHSMPSFLARYGGDEFIIILHPVDREEVEQISGEIREEIRQNVSGRKTPYRITVSIGCEELTGAQDDIDSCLERADKKLYLDKATIKRQRRQAV